jgi:hypothetical protein
MKFFEENLQSLFGFSARRHFSVIFVPFFAHDKPHSGFYVARSG